MLFSFQKSKDTVALNDSSSHQNNPTGKYSANDSIPFTKKQLEFLIKEFKLKFGNAAAKVNSRIGKTISIWQQGEKGNVPGIEFNPFYIQNSAVTSIMMAIKKLSLQLMNRRRYCSMANIFCLKEMKAGHSRLIRLNYLCPCFAPLRCQDSSHPELMNVVGDKIVIKTGCLGSDHAECCPGIYYEVIYKYKNDSLVQIGKRKFN